MKIKNVNIINITILCILVIGCPLLDDDDKGDDKKPPANVETFALSVTANDHGAVVVSPNKTEYKKGSIVTLLGKGEPGYTLLYWENDITGNTNPLVITMEKDMNINAFFGVGKNTITGIVVDSLGGAPVPSAEINIKDFGLQTFTDTNGLFTINNVGAGVYDIEISKGGRAGSRIQNYTVYDFKSNFIEIVLPEYESVSTDYIPPIISISGIEENEIYNGSIDISVDTTPGFNPVTGTSKHKSIYLKIGCKSGLSTVAESENGKLNFIWDTSLYPPGKINIKAVCYDSNNNRSVLEIPVIVSENIGSPPIETLNVDKEDYFITVSTFGESLDIYEEEYGNMRVYGSEQDSTILVDFAFFSEPGDKYLDNGVNIYRSDEVNGKYELIGCTADKQVYKYYNRYDFVDSSYFLSPDKNVWYKFSYFNNYGEGPLSKSVLVTPFPKYNLNLTFPGNNMTIYNNQPTFYWNPGYEFVDPIKRKHNITVTDEANNVVWEKIYFSNTSQITSKNILEYNKTYKWEVTSFYYDSNDDTNVTTFSYPSRTDNSNNGPYYFKLIEDIQ